MHATRGPWPSESDDDSSTAIRPILPSTSSWKLFGFWGGASWRGDLGVTFIETMEGIWYQGVEGASPGDAEGFFSALRGVIDSWAEQCVGRGRSSWMTSGSKSGPSRSLFAGGSEDPRSAEVVDGSSRVRRAAAAPGLDRTSISGVSPSIASSFRD